MNIKQAAITLTLSALAAGAMASEATQWNPPAGNLTRAEVKADLARAVANGELEDRGENYAGFFNKPLPPSTVTREEVKLELARARANGELETHNESYGGIAYPQARVPARAFAWHKLHFGKKPVVQGSVE